MRERKEKSFYLYEPTHFLCLEKLLDVPQCLQKTFYFEAALKH